MTSWNVSLHDQSEMSLRGKSTSEYQKRNQCFLRLVGILLVAGCAAGTSPDTPPRLLVEASQSGRGWPFGESGDGPLLLLTATSRNEDYGWTPKKPVSPGGYDSEAQGQGGLVRQQRYMNSLWGPHGETIFYERIGTCCPFDLYGAPLDKGMLDVYALTWNGLAKPKHLYLDRYREGPLKIPVGLTTKVKPPVALLSLIYNLGSP